MNDPFSMNNPYMSGYLQMPGSMYGGQPVIRNQLFDLSGFPGLQGAPGMMLGMMLQPMLNNYMGNYGFMPGQFQPTQNIYDSYRSINWFQQNQAAASQAASVDQLQYQRTLRGIAFATGSRFGINQDMAAQSMAQDISKFTPFLVQMAPELLDQLGGVRGSNAVMSHYMHLGGRYARDPITGLTGMSGASAGALSNRVYENLYGPGADIGQMKGMGAGEVGRLYDELNRRGFMGAAADRFSAAKAARPDLAGKSRSEIDQLIGSDGGLADTIRSGEADRISQRLKNLSGVVTAMRDIFGDMGKPNAPIPEILNGLQALTQGGLASMDPSRLEMMVRQTYNLSKSTGIGMDNMMRLMGGAAGRADQLGLDRSFALTATQGAVAFGQAYSEVGRGDLAYWGKPDKDKLTVLDQNLRMQAAASITSQTMNAALYIGANMKVGGEAADYIDAIKNGRTTFGAGRSVAMNQAQFVEMMGRSGVDRQMALNILASPTATQEYGAMYDTTGLSRRLQTRLDVEPILLGATGNMVQQFVGGKVSGGVANRMTLAALRAGLSMPEEIRADAEARNSYIAEAMAGASGDAMGAGALGPLAAGLYARYRETVATNPRLAGYGSFEALALAQDPKILARERGIQQEAAATGELQSALSGLNRIGPLRRLVTALSENTVGDKPFGALVSEALGGIPVGEKAGLESKLTNIDKLSREYYGASPAMRKKILAEIKGLAGEVTDTAGKTYVTDASVTPDMASDVAEMLGRGDATGSRHAGSLAGRMMASKGNLAQLGKGAPRMLRDIMNTSQQIDALVSETGMSMTEILAGGAGDAKKERASQLMAQMKGQWSIVNSALADGKPSATPMTATDEKELAEITLSMKKTPDQAVTDLVGALGAKPSDEQRRAIAGYLGSSGRTGSVAMASANWKKVRDLARRKGIINTDGKSPSALIGELQSMALSDDERSLVESVSPLSQLGAGSLDEASVKRAFPAAPGSDAARASAPPSKLVVSGKVTFEAPNTLVFADVQGLGNLPDVGSDRHPRGSGTA